MIDFWYRGSNLLARGGTEAVRFPVEQPSSRGTFGRILVIASVTLLMVVALKASMVGASDVRSELAELRREQRDSDRIPQDLLDNLDYSQVIPATTRLLVEQDAAAHYGGVNRRGEACLLTMVSIEGEFGLSATCGPRGDLYSPGVSLLTAVGDEPAEVSALIPDGYTIATTPQGETLTVAHNVIALTAISSEVPSEVTVTGDGREELIISLPAEMYPGSGS